MSQFSRSRDEDGRTLLSLASWMESENPERRPGMATALDARRMRRPTAPEADAARPQPSPLLAGLARGPRPHIPQDQAAPSGPSVADLLRRRSKRLVRQPAATPAEEVKPAEPEIPSPPRRPAPPRSQLLNLPRTEQASETRPSAPGREWIASNRKAGSGRQKVQLPIADTKENGPAPRRSRGGIMGTIEGLMRRRSGTSRGDAASPARSARLSLPRASREESRTVPAAETGSVQPPASPVVRDPATEPTAGVQPEARPPAPPAHVAHPPPAPYAPMPSHPAATAMPAQPTWPAGPAFYPWAQAPMAPPASAHFYWHQPAPVPHWVSQPAAGWSIPAQPVTPSAPAVEARAWPSAANDSPAYAAELAAPYSQPGPDPLTSEIDEVRERLRAFGETLRELRRTRISRRAG